MPRSTSKNAGRSTTGEPRVPYYVRAPHIEAARHLRLTVTRYLADRAAPREIEEALRMLLACVPAQERTAGTLAQETSTPSHMTPLEAARHLRLTVTRYLADRGTPSEIEDAMDILRASITSRGK